MFPCVSLLLLAGCCSTDPAGLTDPDPDVRRERLACMADAAVKRPGEREMIGQVRTAALRVIDPSVEPHVSVRATGHRAIERLRLVDLGPAVASRLVDGDGQDPSPLVRAAAAAALGELGGADAVDALRRTTLRDASSEVRAAAARELGELRDRAPGTSDALIRALRDESGAVRLNARRSLRQIHGADLGFDPATWSAWLDRRAAGARATEPAPDEPPSLPYEHGLYGPDGDDDPDDAWTDEEAAPPGDEGGR